MTTKKVLGTAWDYVVITIGTILYCMGWTSFMIPQGISSGGGTGICTIIYFATGFPVAYSFIILNIILLIVGIMALGKGFGFRTIYSILLSTVLFWVLARPEFEFLNVAKSIHEPFVVAVIGGLIEAFGIAMILKRGGSTGGTDIAAMVVNKYWPISPGKVYLYCDIFIIASVLLIPGKNVADMIYGYIVMIAFSYSVDAFLLGSKSSVQMLIFSSKYHEIADYLVSQMDRGVTALNSVGWYSGKEGKVLLVVCRKRQLHDITVAVKRMDPHAFMSISSANEVYGEGFEEIKTGVKLRKNSQDSSKTPEK